ncbi:MAG: CDP-alcohol phosphatidyltransferase family protein [Burkholderiaceae bacterium]
MTSSAGAKALCRDAAAETAVVTSVLLAAASLAVLADRSSHWYLVAVMVVFFAAAGVAARWLPAHPHHRFGPANRVTLSRLALVALLAGWLVEPAVVPSWGLVATATLAASLDALDGALARRSHLASEFGARFDMETDALLILVLCALLWRSGRAGAWVLLAGGLRYLFVAAAWRWPALARPLPPSLRRKTICVLLIILLISGLGPIVPSGLAALLAAGGVLLVAASFAVDIGWLLRQPVTAPPHENRIER